MKTRMQKAGTRILIIYIGGTIGMTYREETYVPRPLNFYEVEKRIPEIRKFGFSYSILSIDPPIDSANMQPEIWIALVRIIGENYEVYDGFIILHGTDTMAFTASALSFMLENLSKPVVLTGAQLPIGEVRTDARGNLLTAIEIAGAKDWNGKAMVPEVCICFGDKVYRGNRACKADTEHFNAFESRNYPLLAKAGVQIDYRKLHILSPTELPVWVHTHLEKNVAAIHFFPGIQKQEISAIFQIRDLKGIVLETFGNGNVPTQKWLLALIKEAVERGILLINVTQCMGGSVIQGKYETSAFLNSAGVISGKDMTFEAAVTKMMFVLGLETDLNHKKKLMRSSLRGELSE